MSQSLQSLPKLLTRLISLQGNADKKIITQHHLLIIDWNITWDNELVTIGIIDSSCGSVGSVVTSDTRGSKPVISKSIRLNICFLSTVLKRQKIKKKEGCRDPTHNGRFPSHRMPSALIHDYWVLKRLPNYTHKSDPRFSFL